ncbi:hypothetical protein [Ochrovirga pacifica]|uniref:hypothetical protein n=1 Tax=Ochrovirga pacifica TaxID=1042376 RepID=UPI0002558E86|nr:hypothetical protein [Ochrovirga pacifica]
MKNKIFLIILLLGFFNLSSCYIAKYNHFGDVNIGVNFTQGKWLLNNIQPDNNNLISLDTNVFQKFHNLLGNRISRINKIPGLLFPSETPKSIDKSYLKNLKNGTQFDYFINVRTNILSSESGNILIKDIYEEKKNSAEITLEIYDINSLKIIYSHTVHGSVTIDEGENDISFVKNTENIINTSFNRIFKKLQKNSIK